MSSTLAAGDPASQAASRLPGPILAAVGEDGRRVLRTAAALSPLALEHVHVFSVVEPLPAEGVVSEPRLTPSRVGEVREVRREARIAYLGTRLAEIRAADRWKLEVDHGDPASTLLRRARELDAALIVIGIGHQRAADRSAGEEMALRVTRRSTCPVLAVCGELDRRPREVVVATDFSAQSIHAARAALRLLDRGATLHVVHVREVGAGSPVPKVDEAVARSLTARLIRFVADLRTPTGVLVRMTVCEGQCATQLVAYARKHGADLVVASRQGLHAITRSVVGSVPLSLLRSAGCSVLIAPEQSFDATPTAP